MIGRPLCIVLSVAAALALLLGPGAALAQNPPLPVDHYKVYRVTPQTGGTLVKLIDQFGTADVRPMYLDRFANPVSKNHEGIVDTVLHYAWWRIDNPEPTRHVLVGNQFGRDQEWMLGPARYLLNPALKNPREPTEPLPTNVNHYKCYEAFGPTPTVTLTLEDQFGFRNAMLGAAKCFCNPAEKWVPDGPIYPIAVPDTHLACYEIRPILQYAVTATFLDQFLWGDLYFIEDCLLCVPSTKEVIVPTERGTWGRVKDLYR